MDKRFPLADQIVALASTLDGRVVLPHDPDYDALRALVMGNFDRRPAALVRVGNTGDVAAVLTFARATGLDVAVRSGGHSPSGYSCPEGGIVIDLRDLNGIDIDVEGRTVWAGCGLTAGELTAAVEPHQLIVGFGDTASVGIGGITLGGGIGYLVRKHGLTIDSVIGAEVVTAAGDILLVDASHHADLFWALRGGGGNFGVVTRWQYRLHPLPAFTGGPLILPATAEVVSGFVAAAQAAPDELSCIASIMPAPPLPFLPAELHGRIVLVCMMAFAGAPEAAARALTPFRALATPLADHVQAGPYSSMFMPEAMDERPAAAVRSRLTNRLGPAEAQAMLDHVMRSDAPMRLGEIRVLGGAAARVPEAATAFAHRQSRFMVSFIALFGNTDAPAPHDQWATEGITALDSGDDDRVYVNFLAGDGAERLQAAYPEATLERLRRVKRLYDPENLFRLNHNISPA